MKRINLLFPSEKEDSEMSHFPFPLCGRSHVVSYKVGGDQYTWFRVLGPAFEIQPSQLLTLENRTLEPF